MVGEMGKEIRKTGIDVIGDVSWGSHLCQFYETKEDLIDILVPYFKAGLENNEFCMWVTSKPLELQDAKVALRKAVGNLDEYLESGQIEFLDYSQWYTKSGKFDSDEVLRGWVDKHDRAIQSGFDGLRLTGNTFWLEEGDWRSFVDYEAVVDDVIGKYRMIAICSYALDKCRASEIIKVVSAHQYTLVRREGNWELIESSARKRAEAELQKRTHDLGERGKEQACLYGISDLAGKQGISLEEIARGAVELIPPGWQYPEITCARIILEGQEFTTRNFRETGWKQAQDITVHGERIGTVEACYLEERPGIDKGPFLKEERDLLNAVAQQLGTITERKRAEEALRERELRFHTLVENMLDCVGIYSAIRDDLGRIIDFRVDYVNAAACANNLMTKEEQTGKRLLELLPAHRETGLFDEYCEIVETGQPLAKEALTYEDVYGKEQQRLSRAFEIRATKLGDGFVAAWRDITERKRAEDRLLVATQEWRTTFDAINDGVCLLDTERKLLRYNSSLPKLLGKPLSEIMNNNWCQLVHGTSAVPVEGCPLVHMKETRHRESAVFLIGERWFNVTVDPVLDESGNLAGAVHIMADITERKLMEQQLQDYSENLERKVEERTQELKDTQVKLARSEQRYRSIFEHAGDAIVVYDRNWAVQGWNRRAEEMFGYKAEEVVGRQAQDLVRPTTPAEKRDNRRRMEQLAELATGQGFYRSQEITSYMRKDGKALPVEATGAVIRDGGGKLIGFSAIFRDISERKRLERELAHSEEKYRALFEHAGDAIVVFDTKCVIGWNRRAEEMFGYKAAEVVGRPWQAIALPAEPAARREARREAERLAAEAETDGFYQGRETVSYMRKDGRLFPLEASGAQIRDKEGKLIGFSAIFRDITERKRLEKELADSEEKYRTIFEHAGDAIVVYDANWVIRGWNRRAEEMFGYKAEEVLGRPWQDLMPAAKSEGKHGARRDAERLAAEVERQGFYRSQELVTYITKGYRPLPVETTGAIVRDSKGKPALFVAISRDISDRKRLEGEREEYARKLEAKIEEVERTRGELEEAQEQLVASERMAAIGKLASMVSHELRNPLGVIGNSAYYLKMKLGDGGEKVKSHLDILEKEVAICSKIISELLDFGRPAKPAVGEADINSIVEQTLSCCQVPSNVELVTELGEGLPKVMADKDQMQQVFHNLLLNAAQAMPQGGRLTVRTAHRDNLVQAEFADTGIGIPRDNLTRIFQPLFSTKAKGTGLGLAVTESILDRHGGTIEVESEEGKGTTFTVSLPVLQAGEAKP